MSNNDVLNTLFDTCTFRSYATISGSVGVAAALIHTKSDNEMWDDRSFGIIVSMTYLSRSFAPSFSAT